MQTKKYQVECVDRDTGEKSLHVFEGVDDKSASDLANRMGFFVGSVTEVPEYQRRAFPWGVALASLVVGVVIGAGGLFAAVHSGQLAMPPGATSPTPNPVVAAPNQNATSPTPNPAVAMPNQNAVSPKPVPKSLSPLADLPDALKLIAFENTVWSLSVDHESKDYPLRDQVREIEILEELRSKPITAESARLVVTHATELKTLFVRLSLVGDELIRFIPGNWPTASFVKFNGQKCLVLSNMTTGLVYNTRRLGSKERAAEVVQTRVLPILSDVFSAFEKSDVSSFAIIHFYGSKDFVNDDRPDTRGEIVCVVVKKSDMRDFINVAITREELIRRSSVFLSDRDSQSTFNRVELTLR